jgi:hypothetical protein
VTGEGPERSFALVGMAQTAGLGAVGLLSDLLLGVGTETVFQLVEPGNAITFLLALGQTTAVRVVRPLTRTRVMVLAGVPWGGAGHRRRGRTRRADGRGGALPRGDHVVFHAGGTGQRAGVDVARVPGRTRRPA